MIEANKKGIALAVALVLSVVFLILGIAYLSFVGRDYFLNGVNHESLQAYYLAKSGVNYYTNQGFFLSPNSTMTIQFSGMNPQEYFCVVNRGSNGQLVFQGVVKNGNGSRVSRSITLP
jgi:hypothetical protein